MHLHTLQIASLLLAAPALAQEVGPRRLGRTVDGEVQISEYVRNLFEDSRGHLWIGSNGEGVFRYDGSALTQFDTGDGLAGGQNTGFLEDDQGHVWMASDGGVSRFDGRAFASYTSAHGLSSDRVWHIFRDRDGVLWAGTAAGLCTFDGERFAPFEWPALPGFPTPRVVWSTAQAPDGALWFATDHGVRILENGELRALLAPDGPGDERIGEIVFDREGHVWIPTSESGIYRWDGSSFLRFDARDEIGGNEVYGAYLDPKGRVWFNAEGFGIYRWDGERLRNYATEQGLGVLAVQAILEDRQGRLWAGGGGGLYRLEGERFVHVTRGGPWKH